VDLVSLMDGVVASVVSTVLRELMANLTFRRGRRGRVLGRAEERACERRGCGLRCSMGRQAWGTLSASSRLAVAGVRFHSLLQWTLKLLVRRSIRHLRVRVVCFMVAPCVERVPCDGACVVVTGAA
jgi:hypothetical protein